jgi:hypothetical protein
VRPVLVVRLALKVQPALVVRPSMPPGPNAARLWCVCLIQHVRDGFGLLGASVGDYTWCELNGGIR